jgi:hypothetical protein
LTVEELLPLADDEDLVLEVAGGHWLEQHQARQR